MPATWPSGDLLKANWTSPLAIVNTSASVKTRSWSISREPRMLSIVAACTGSCCCSTVVGTQSHRIPFQIGVPDWITHRTALRGVMACRLTRFCCGLPGIRSRLPREGPAAVDHH